MSFIQQLRDRFARPQKSGFLNYNFRIDRQVAYYLTPLIERMASGDNEAWILLNAVRFHFIGERPISAIHLGEEVRLYVEGPRFECGDETFPIGAQVSVGWAGWVNLDPVEASDLDYKVRKAIDEAVFRWVSEANLTGRTSPCRQPRSREHEDHIALRQMVTAAGRSARESEAARG
ncbi:hypothetical protein FGU71_04100 [Erythrobacter insulae]|uniref:Uncharacterized protein n=1 Tax=Erythrobacter insulae TaxID=2584124 RepID=A0A547PAF3_9SPHN|nr:hypothetical protein [Erythrobacter insulae]TRD11113.1 hypothetical protein FGU71_04100 [Erythrobacter insulae]